VLDHASIMSESSDRYLWAASQNLRALQPGIVMVIVGLAEDVAGDLSAG
jgi:hypothetical protein